MSYYDRDEDVFGATSSQFLSPSKPNGRKTSSSRQVNGRKSAASLRGSSSLAQVIDEDAAGSRHSLAHELAVALMPEPSAGSKLLAEEFGIEYDEGAEGIDEQLAMPATNGHTLSNELDIQAWDTSATPSLAVDPPPEDLGGNFSPSSPITPPRQPEQDAMAVLSRDLETTDKFLTHLRHLDTESAASSSEPPLERIASDMIRRINETARDREGQVRELLECEREFRKIAGEVGGNDVLGQLDELVEVEGLREQTSTAEPARIDSRQLETVHEDSSHPRQSWNDWETDPDQHILGDDDHDDLDHESLEPDSPSPMKDSFPQAPTMHGPVTAAKTLPHLVHMRTLTTSVVASLTAISEHAQVNGAATADAGRKIRALKNKLGGWRTEWDSAERSRLRIEKWEAGLDDDGEISTAASGGSARLDGRRFVEEHLRAFQVALADAGTKTQAIMAVS